MHLDVEQLHRLLDGELSPADEQAAREHLAHCGDCRRRVAAAQQAESELQAQLRQLDHAPPRVTAADIAARAGAPRAPHRPALRWAAAMLLAVGLAGAAYAAPGSPVRAWVRGALAWVRGEPPRREQGPEARSGIAVAPGQGLIISFASRQPGAEVQVILTDGHEVVVRAPMGAATFTSDVERLVIHNSADVASPVFEIEIPRTAPRVEIQVPGERRFLKQGSVISGAYRFPL
jgi:anti-sigma factor RsiW